MQSLRSDALEPTRLELAHLSPGQRLARLLPVYGLPILAVLLILLFSAILPQTFPTMLNLRSILGDKAVIALLSLAAMIPMMAGRIDLTIGYSIVLWHILAIALQTQLGLPWWVAVPIVLLLGCGLGLLNGLLVEIARIDSFIATLGTGTILHALALWYTEGRQVIGVLPPGFLALYTTRILGLPIATYQNAGIRVFDIRDQYHPVEVGAFVPPAPQRLVDQRPNRDRVIQACDVFVDKAGLVYANDYNGGLSILEFEG